VKGGPCGYYPWGHVGGGNLDEATMKRWAQRELRGKRLVGANIRFDNHQFREWGIDLEAQGCVLEDVQHFAALLDDHRREFNLNSLGKDYLGRGKLGEDLDKTRMKFYHAGQVARYAEEDARLVGELYDVLTPRMAAEDLDRVRTLESDLIFPICEMEKNAAPLDVELLNRWCEESKRVWLDCIWTIAREVGFVMNPDSPTSWKRLFRHYNIPITHFTEAGTPSFTDLVLKNIDNPMVQLARRAGKYASLRSKFLVAYADAIGPDGLLRYSLHQLRTDEGGTVSGRFSCSDKNIQQVMTPSKQELAFGNSDFIVRKLYIARHGLFFCSDAMQIEYRLFANYAGNPAVLEAYRQNPMQSYHNFVWEMVKKYLPDLPYRRAKDCNFARLYGAGDAKLAQMLEVTLGEAEVILRIYERMFPEVGKLLKKASNLAKNRGFVRTLLGRRARFPDGDRSHKALNSVIQGGAADIMKIKIVELHKRRAETGLTMRMTVHDEIDGDVPDQESAKKVEKILNEQAFPLKVPILWECSTGSNWAEAKS
jgi:DNA polymerase-1